MSNEPSTSAERRLLDTFIRKYAQSTTALSHAHDADLPFTTCLHCDDTKVILKGHSTTHGWREEPYPCPYCAKGKR